jgi:beta-galactosidase
VVRRIGDAGSFLFAINHTPEALELRASGTDLVSGAVHTGTVTVPAGGVVVLDEAR